MIHLIYHMLLAAATVRIVQANTVYEDLVPSNDVFANILSCAAGLVSLQKVQSFPATVGTLQKCERVNSKRPSWDGTRFCFLSIRDRESVDYLLENPSNTSSTSRRDYRIALSGGLCVPNSCSAGHFELGLSYICSIRRCKSAFDSSYMQNACSMLQQLVCSTSDRWQFGRQVHMECDGNSREHGSTKFEQEKKVIEWIMNNMMRESTVRDVSRLIVNALTELHSKIDEDDGDEDDVEDSDFLNEFPDVVGDVVNMTSNLISSILDKSQIFRVSMDSEYETLLSSRSIKSLLSCGLSTLSDPKLLLASGSYQDLGDYQGCMDMSKLENTGDTSSSSTPYCRYCTLHYIALISSGRCVSGQCDEETFQDFMQSVCQLTGGGQVAQITTKDNHQVTISGSTCLDYLNVIPLDLCLMVNLFGCADSNPIRFLNAATDTARILDVGLFRKDYVAAMLPHQRPRKVLQDHHLLSLTGLRFDDLSFKAKTLKITNTTRQSTYDVGIKCQNANQSRDFWSFRGYLFFAVTIKIFILLPLLGKLAAGKNFKYVKKEILNLGEQLHNGNDGSWPKAAPSSPLLEKQRVAEPVNRNRLSSLLFSQHGFPLDPLNKKFANNLRFCRQFLACYSVKSSLCSWKDSLNKLRQGPYAHVCGIRVLSMWWIVLGHCFSFAVLNGTVKEIQGAVKLTSSLDFQFILSGALSVDTFFFLSGFFLAIIALPSIVAPKSSWEGCKMMIYAVVKRYLRLWAVYCAVGILFYTGSEFLLSGPNVPALVNTNRHGIQGGCDKYWWTNALFINNLIPRGSPIECIGWSWYLANDFQFFILGMLLLVVRSLSVFSFRFMSVFLLLSSLICGWVVNYKNNLHVSSLALSAATDGIGHGNWLIPINMTDEYYVKPWCRCPPYLIGFLIGVAITHPKCRTYISKMSSFISLGHVVVTSVMAFLVFVPYLANKDGAKPWNRSVELAYLTLNRSIWVLCVAWFTVTLAFVSPSAKSGESPTSSRYDGSIVQIKDGLSRAIKEGLSTSWFICFSTLVYSLYLIHPVLQQWSYATYPIAYGFNRAFGYFNVFSFSIVGMLLAFVFVILVEIPTSKCFRLMGV